VPSPPLKMSHIRPNENGNLILYFQAFLLPKTRESNS
jgi:hypothetical protein